MELPHESVLLRIFIGESDRHVAPRPLYEAIVLKARELHLAGATVLRGAMGFGKSSRMHTSKIWSMAMTRPPAFASCSRTAHRRASAAARTSGSHSPSIDNAARSRWLARVVSRASSKPAA